MAELVRDNIAAHQWAVCRSGHATVTWLAYTGLQVKPMRFSSLFQSPTPAPEARRDEPAREAPHPPGAPAQDLPDDLDARVRLIGEWQLGEA